MLNFIHVKNDLNRCIIFVCACAVADWPHGTRLTNYHCVTFTLKIVLFLYQMVYWVPHSHFSTVMPFQVIMFTEFKV